VAAPIQILNASSLQAGDIEKVARAVEGVFNLTATVSKAPLDIQAAYDNSRRQFNSTALLTQILSIDNPPKEKRIAIVDVDLYIPILTFIFGEAQLDGTAAIVSTHRLANQFYGLEEDRFLTLGRLQKEVIHELGHTFGLYHCLQFECVMRASTYVEEIDLKQSTPCHACMLLLKEDIKKFSFV